MPQSVRLSAARSCIGAPFTWIRILRPRGGSSSIVHSKTGLTGKGGSSIKVGFATDVALLFCSRLLIGRLKDGVSLEQTQAEADAFSEYERRQDPIEMTSGFHILVGSRTGAVARRSILGCSRGFPLRVRLGLSVAPSRDTRDPMCRPAQMSPQLLVFPIGPSGQRAIQLPHRRIMRRAIIPPVILEPAPDDRVKHARQIFDRLIAAQMQLPAPNLRPYGLPRLVRNRRAEVDKVLAKAILRSSWPKRIAKKVELLVRVVASSIIILAVDDLRLLRMKLQPAFLQPCGYCRPNFLSFLLYPAVHNSIIGVSLKRQVRVVLPQSPRTSPRLFPALRRCSWPADRLL